MVVVCARGGNFFPRAEKKTSADERKVARRRRRQKRDVRFLEEFAERKRVVANERRWFGRVAVARSSAPARRRSWINSSFFLKRESAFEEWLTPQKRELFFEDFFPLFLFLAKRVVASTIERKARESSEGGLRMNDVVRIVSRVLDDDDDDDDDGALVHEMDNG